jgi:hypothetical protein
METCGRRQRPKNGNWNDKKIGQELKGGKRILERSFVFLEFLVREKEEEMLQRLMSEGLLGYRVV